MHLAIVKAKLEAGEVSEEFAAVLEAVLSKATRDLGRALAKMAEENPAAFVSGMGGETLWRDVYQKPIEAAWRAYAGDIMNVVGSGEFERLFGDAAFNLQNVHAQRYLEGRGAELVRNVTRETRKGVRLLVREMLTGGAGSTLVGRTSDAIGNLVGLNERDTRSLLSKVEALRAQGVAESVIAREQQRYVDRALTRRGHLIARTEGMRAEAQGVMTAWQQATDDGLLPKGARRKWIAEGPTEGPHRVCDVCIALDKLAPIGLDVPFVTKEFGPVWAPPAHPACRCTLGLVAPSGW